MIVVIYDPKGWWDNVRFTGNVDEWKHYTNNIHYWMMEILMMVSCMVQAWKSKLMMTRVERVTQVKIKISTFIKLCRNHINNLVGAEISNKGFDPLNIFNQWLAQAISLDLVRIKSAKVNWWSVVLCIDVIRKRYNVSTYLLQWEVQCIQRQNTWV